MDEHEGGAILSDVKNKLKKVPKWVWIGGGAVLIFVFVRARYAGGGSSVTAPSYGDIGGGSGGGGSPGDWTSIPGFPGTIPGGGSGGSETPPSWYTPPPPAVPVVDIIDIIDKQQAERDTAITNALTGLTAAITTTPSTITPVQTTPTGINQNANVLSKYLKYIPFVDPEGNGISQSAGVVKQINAFTQGFGAGDWNTATVTQKKQIMDSEKLLRSGDSGALAAELARTKSVINYRESTGQSTTDQYKHLSRVETIISNPAKSVMPQSDKPKPAAPAQSYLNTLVSGSNKGAAAWAKAQPTYVAPKPVPAPTPSKPAASSSSQKTYLDNLIKSGSGAASWAKAQIAAGKY